MSIPRFLLSDEPGWAGGAATLYNLVYCSRAVPGVDDAAVERIIETARRNNPRDEITGLLVFGGGIFFQVLEGPRDAVRRLLGNLRSDARHADIVILNEADDVDERLFPTWDMELVEAGDISEVLRDALHTTQDPKNARALKVMLEQLESGSLQDLEGS